jgi:hypothetical protein
VLIISIIPFSDSNNALFPVIGKRYNKGEPAR